MRMLKALRGTSTDLKGAAEMQRVKVMGLALVAVLAMSAITAGAASATRVLRLTDAGVPLTSGTEIEMYGGINFETPSGPMNCSEYGLSDFYGKVVTNLATKDTVSISGPLEIWGNVGGLGACEAPTVLGPATVSQVEGFPSTLTLTSVGTAKLVPTAGKLVLKMEFTGGVVCYYQRASLTGDVGVPLSPKPAELEFTSQKFALNGILSTKKTCLQFGSYVLFNLHYENSYIEPLTNAHESLLISK